MESSGSEKPAADPELIQQPPKAFAPDQFMPSLESVKPYLETLAYKAIDATSWEVTPGSAGSPKLAIKVTGHHESEGHTWYHVDCALTKPPGSPAPEQIKWRAPRRLKHMREELHWNLKKELEIPQKFGRLAGMPGTTQTLDAWCETLAGLINEGQADPKITAAVLRFLDVPADGKARVQKDLDTMMDEITSMVSSRLSGISQSPTAATPPQFTSGLGTAEEIMEQAGTGESGELAEPAAAAPAEPAESDTPEPSTIGAKLFEDGATHASL